MGALGAGGKWAGLSRQDAADAGRSGCAT